MGDVAPMRGMDVIRAHVRTLPARPGVYRMIDEAGQVLYVGKAKSLKARVMSYTRPSGHTNRIAAMIANTAAMEFVTTGSEAEALLLEANLIKKLKPRYNVVLRDDKSFPYILIARSHAAARLAKHRGARRHEGRYFGPFASAGAVNRAINALQRAFLLRTCSDSVYDNRTRPCLLYQIKRCAAPCTGEISLADYDRLVAQAEDFLSGRSAAVKADLARAMEAAADALDFETAARYRDRIAAMAHVTAQQGINPEGIDKADVFAVAQEGGLSAVQVFFIRAGQNWGARVYFPRADKTFGESEVLSSFITQFYDDRPPPRHILTNVEAAERGLLEEAFTARIGRKVTIRRPQRGSKRELSQLAAVNAREALARRIADARSQNRLLAGLAKAFALERAPRRIEVYDNSHIQGSNAVGAMIVAGSEGFAKAHYRKFNIKVSPDDNPAGDDYAMMRQVLVRRFSRLQREHGPKPESGDEGDGETLPAWPDLVIIDGGRGQLGVAREVLADLDVAGVDVVAIAKGPERDAGREHFHLPDREPFMLDPRDPVLYYVQRLRDEAHRFAIGAHRARRARGMAQNPLDEIAGIGPGRKKALLQAFGSARAVGRASIADLCAVQGISRALAAQIYSHFHEGG